MISESSSFLGIREQVLAVVRKLCQAGLVRLSVGNVSARDPSGYVAITPTGVPYDVLCADDIVIVDLDGNVVSGHRSPSSETPMHTAILKSLPAINAVIHTHSIYAMAFSIAGRSIPVVCTEGLFVGGELPVARYATPGTFEAGEAVLEALSSTEGLRAVLLRNHGLVAVGESLEEAWEVAYKAEIQAEAYYLALQVGKPTPLSAQQLSAMKAAYLGARDRVSPRGK